MSDAIYNDAIKAAARDRSHVGRLPSPDASVTCDNPLCGDRVTLDVKLAGGRVAEIAHKTRGCMLTEAAAGMVASLAPSMPVERLDGLLGDLHHFLAEGGPAPWPELAMFAPVHAVKSRHECVLLPFEAAAAALADADR